MASPKSEPEEQPLQEIATNYDFQQGNERSGTPEKFNDQIMAKFLFDPVRLYKKAKLAHDRSTIEKHWDEAPDGVYNLCPFTRTGFHIEKIIPDRHLHRKMSKWLSRNPTAEDRCLIPGYTKFMGQPGMQQCLEDVATTTAVTELTTKLRMLRLQCQYSVGNRKLFLDANGEKVLLDVMSVNRKQETLFAEGLRMLIGIKNSPNLPRLLTEYPAVIMQSVSNICNSDLRGVRLDSLHLLHLFTTELEHPDHKFKKLLEWAVPFVISALKWNSPLNLILPILLSISSLSSLLVDAMARSRAGLTRLITKRMQSLPSWLQPEHTKKELEAYLSRTPEPGGMNSSYLEMMLEIVLKLCHLQAGRLAFLHRDNGTLFTVRRLIELKVVYYHKNATISDNALRHALQIMNIVFQHCEHRDLLVRTFNSVYLYADILHASNRNRLPDDIRQLARCMLQRYLRLESFHQNMQLRAKSNFPSSQGSILPSDIDFDAIRRVLASS